MSRGRKPSLKRGVMVMCTTTARLFEVAYATPIAVGLYNSHVNFKITRKKFNKEYRILGTV